mgnify:CR=1 FL=1
MSKRFALTGAAGYIAPRHLRAIQDTGNELVAILDPHDSVGIIDSYFPEARFFKEPERFDRHLEKLRRKGKGSSIDWMTVCSPNYLHDAHIRMALRVGADVICEKPLVLNPWNIDAINELETETGKNVYCLLQLRNHPEVSKLREMYHSSEPERKAEISVTYIAPRGVWYLSSWKGDPERSGGLASNIGVHFFDMLLWIFGKVIDSHVYVSKATKSAGYIELERAQVHWYLSIDREDLAFTVSKDSDTYRSMTVNGEEVDLSGGFKDLHTATYRAILEGTGTRCTECRDTIQLLHDIRNAEPESLDSNGSDFIRKGMC